MCGKPTTPPVVVSDVCRRAIASWAVASDDGLETGGALFGVERSDGTLEIRHASDAGPNAERRRDFFARDLAYTDEHADRLFALDGSQWVGEWHTHPHADLLPSALDMTTYIHHLADEELGFQRFASIIVGSRDGGTRAMLWVVEGCVAVGQELVLT